MSCSKTSVSGGFATRPVACDLRGAALGQTMSSLARGVRDQFEDVVVGPIVPGPGDDGASWVAHPAWARPQRGQIEGQEPERARLVARVAQFARRHRRPATWPCRIPVRANRVHRKGRPRGRAMTPRALRWLQAPLLDGATAARVLELCGRHPRAIWRACGGKLPGEPAVAPLRLRSPLRPRKPRLDHRDRRHWITLGPPPKRDG